MEGVTEIDVEGIISRLRNDSVAWVNSKYEKEQIAPKDWSMLSKVRRDNMELGPVMKSTMQYIMSRLKGTCDYLVHDKFIYDYDVRCNMDRPARFDTECVSLSFSIKWQVKPVRATLYNASVRTVRIQAEMSSIISDMHVKDMGKFAKLTGLSSTEVKTPSMASKVDSILRLYSIGSAGQNKITRLVKGCLIYLDRLESGGARFPDMAYQGIPYTVDALYDRLGEANISYVYSTMPENETYNHFLYAMCEQYPHPRLGGVSHVKIPADGKHVYLVAKNVHPGVRNVYLTASVVMGFLIQYADDFNLGEDLEKAMVIACSLRENRYLKSVQLPKVMSVTDLIWPVIVKPTNGIGSKTLMNAESAKVIGRYHQMLCLILFKDLDTCIRNTSVSNRNHNVTTRDLCSRDNLVFVDYMQDKACADLMVLTQELIWLRNISDADIEHLRSFSAFEAFWVVQNPKSVLKNGLIHHFKSGWKNPISVYKPGVYVDPYNTLAVELELAGEDSTPTMPDGGFNISLSCVRGKRGKKEKVSFSFSITREAAFECTSKPGPDKPRKTEPVRAYEAGAGGMEDKKSDAGSDAEPEREKEDEEEEESGDDSSAIYSDSSPKPKVILRIKDASQLPPVNDFFERKADDVKDIGVLIEWVEKDICLDYTTSVNGIFRLVRQGYFNPEVRKCYDRYHCTIDVDALMRERGYVYPTLTGTNDNAGPDDEEGDDDEEPDGDEGHDTREPPPPEKEDKAEDLPPEYEEGGPEQTPPGGEGFGGKPHDEEVPFEREVENVETVPIIGASAKQVIGGYPYVSLNPVNLQSVGGPYDPSQRSNIDKLRSVQRPKFGDFDYSAAVSPPPRPRSEPLAFGSSTPRNVRIPQSEKSSRPRVEKSVGWSDAPDWSKEELMGFKNMSIDDFCHKPMDLRRVPANFRGYVQGMAMTDEIKKMGVIKLVRDSILRKNLIDSAEWFLDHSLVGIEEYPDEFKGLMVEIRDSIDRKEVKVQTVVPEEVLAAATSDLERSVLENPDEWVPSSDVLLAELKGMNKYLQKNDWWLRKAQAAFGVQSERTISARDLEWLARYLDDGGNIGDWKDVWRLANNSPITMQMRWHEVSNKMKAITKLQKKMKKDSLNYKHHKDKKRMALEKMKIGDTVREKGRLKREEQNQFVDMIGDMTIGKASLILSQLIETKKFIMHEEKYALVYRFLIVPQPWDNVLAEMLKDHLE